MTTWMFDAKRKSASVDKKKTERIDLPAKGWLSSIAIRLSGMNGADAAGNINNHIHDVMTKIEVIGAGGATLKSLTGVQVQALNWADQESMPWAQFTEAASKYNIEQFILNFGKNYMDTEHMLDCSKIVDGQLKITWDMGAVRATAASAYLGTDQVLDVVYAIPDNYTGPAPQGYIKSTETKSWTSLASGIDYVTLPKDNPIRRIMVRAYESGISPAANITNLKLTANNGSYVPWDNTLTKLKDLNSLWYPQAQMYLDDLLTQDGLAKELNIAFPDEITLTPIAARAAGVSAEAYGNVTIALSDLATPTVISTDEALRMTAEGYGYHNAFMLPFDKPKFDESALLNAATPRYSDLMLEVTQGNAGAATSIVTEELIKQ